MSKYRFEASDIYLPGTEIPANRLGIRDAELLGEVEEILLQQAYQVFVGELEPVNRFDEAYFQTLHQRTFATLYDWAGAYRTVDMIKGDSLFCRAMFLESEARRIFGELKAENYLKDAHA